MSRDNSAAPFVASCLAVAAALFGYLWWQERTESAEVVVVPTGQPSSGEYDVCPMQAPPFRNDEMWMWNSMGQCFRRP